MAATDKPLTLSDRVQLLPPELRDMIYVEVVRCEPHDRHITLTDCSALDEPVQSPLLLVSKATRQRFREAYSSSSFIFCGLRVFKDWVESQYEDKPSLIYNITVVLENDNEVGITEEYIDEERLLDGELKWLDRLALVVDGQVKWEY